MRGMGYQEGLPREEGATMRGRGYHERKRVI